MAKQKRQYEFKISFQSYYMKKHCEETLIADNEKDLDKIFKRIYFGVNEYKIISKTIKIQRSK